MVPEKSAAGKAVRSADLASREDSRAILSTLKVGF